MKKCNIDSILKQISLLDVENVSEIESLIEFSNHKNYEIKEAALDAMLFLPLAVARPCLKNALQDKNIEIIKLTLRLIGTRGDQMLFDEVDMLLENDDETVRELVVFALGAMNSSQAVIRLERHKLKYPNDDQFNIQAALYRLKS